MAYRDIPPFCTYLLSDEGRGFTSWEFDVIVGEPEDPGPFFPLALRRQALYLGALKIDAIGWFYNTPTLIEAKPDATLAAIGQIDSYADWFDIIYGIYPRKMIVCESMRGQVQTICQRKNIDVRICKPADNILIAQALEYVQPLIKPSPLAPNPLELPS